MATSVEQGRQRTGSGRALYEALFERLAARGYLMAVAGMTLPNEASAGLHRAMGFEPVGVYRRIGWKAGAWHDVQWCQLDLHPGEPGPPGGGSTGPLSFSRPRHCGSVFAGRRNPWRTASLISSCA